MSLFQEQAPSCVLKFALRERVSGASSLVHVYWLGYLPGSTFRSVFEEQSPSCVLVGVLTRERVSGACFSSKLPRVYRPLCQGENPKESFLPIFDSEEAEEAKIWWRFSVEQDIWLR